MSCVLHFVIFLFFCQTALHHPLEQPSSTVKTQIKSSENIVEMGQGIEEIPSGCVQTKTLNLAYNHISVLPAYVFSNKSYKVLTKIELYQNKISTIHQMAFRGLKRLTTVILSDNNITSIDPYTFKYNPKLEKLDLARNKIIFHRLQVFLMTQNLETLILSQNRIEQVFELTFIGVPNLKNLILDGNVLYMIAPNSFKPLNKLQYLSLANTGVYRLSESMFNSNLPRIVDIKETPLAKRFDPPLRKLTDNAVRNLINFDQYIFISDTPI